MTRTIAAHRGRVVGYGRGTLLVHLVKEDGECDGCALARGCRQADVVEVPYDGSPREVIGARVAVRTVGYPVSRAAWMWVGWLFLVAAVVRVFTGRDSWAVGAGFAAMFIAIGVWAVRSRLGKPRFELTTWPPE